jgi:hypothetical protein
MSTTTTTMNETPESAAAAAVAEATRIAAQAARTGTENAKASIDAVSAYLEDANTMGRDLLGNWTMQSETALKTAFAAQKAAIDTGLGLFDLGVKGNRQAVAQFSDLVKRTQQATLDSWQTTVKMTTKAADSFKR